MDTINNLSSDNIMKKKEIPLIFFWNKAANIPMLKLILAPQSLPKKVGGSSNSDSITHMQGVLILGEYFSILQMHGLRESGLRYWVIKGISKRT